jgi:hypothetical protein
MDNTVKIWDLNTGTCIHTLTGHTSLVGLIGLSPNHLVSAAADSSLRIWNADNTVELKQVLRNNGGAITCFQHDEHKVVSGSDGMLKLWDIRRGQFVRDLVIGISSVWQVGFNGNLLVAASNRSGTTVFDVFDFGELNDPSGIDNDKLDDLVRQPWEKNVPHINLHSNSHAQFQVPARQRDRDPRPTRYSSDDVDEDVDVDIDVEDEDDIDDEIDWDDSSTTCSPLYRLDKRTNTYYPIQNPNGKLRARRSERLASKSVADSPVAGPSLSTSTKSKRVSFTKTQAQPPSSPSVRGLATKGYRRSLDNHDKAVVTTGKALASASASTGGKGKGKAKASNGPSASGSSSIEAGPSTATATAGPSWKDIKPVERGTARVTRSRSGPANSSSPVRYTRTSSAGHVGSSKGATAGRLPAFAPVFDDEDDNTGRGPTLPRSKPRQLSDEDEDEEDELNSIGEEEVEREEGSGDEDEDEEMPGSGSGSGEGQLETDGDDDMSDGID